MTATGGIGNTIESIREYISETESDNETEEKQKYVLSIESRH